MENSRTSTFTAYVTVAFLLISTFVTMVVTESQIVWVPCNPRSKKTDDAGICRNTY
uniref:U17-myrmicitoxin-Mri1b n=1 Tax=Manica rubida TaxID=219785 RepID=TX17B_MANRB|nr:RecName: Full=U17-myrmicitoxin-Mri1b; Short=U17-MYRTX-Mri1b; Flags: Precursor [Manica rubida]QIQ51455.1 U17-MYRTX-Mri1b precursor [Manica rubida]